MSRLTLTLCPTSLPHRTSILSVLLPCALPAPYSEVAPTRGMAWVAQAVSSRRVRGRARGEGQTAHVMEGCVRRGRCARSGHVQPTVVAMGVCICFAERRSRLDSRVHTLAVDTGTHGTSRYSVGRLRARVTPSGGVLGVCIDVAHVGLPSASYSQVLCRQDASGCH